MNYSGTAFAFNCDHVVTAFHNIYELDKTDDSKLEVLECVLVTKISKNYNDDDVDYGDPSKHIRLEFVEGDKSEDWAVLRRTDGFTFPHPLSICLEFDLPALDDDEAIKPFGFPLASFNLHLSGELFSSHRRSVAQYLGSKLLCIGGLHGGMSGGPYINRLGKVVAIHLASSNETEKSAPRAALSTINYAKYKNKKRTFANAQRELQENIKAMEDSIDHLSSLYDSSIDVHQSISEGLVLCKSSFQKYLKST